MVESDDNFLGRWSRRKAESRQGLKKRPVPAESAEQTATRDSAALSEGAHPGDAGEGERLDRTPEDAAAPREDEVSDPAARYQDFDFDALDYDSDYTQFMQKGVPDAIRRRALRSLWQSNPILANLDGLNDYDEDFTDAALAVDVLKTAYKVGRGYRTDEELEAEETEEMAEADEAELEPEPDTEIGQREAGAGRGGEASEQDTESRAPERRESDETA